MAPRLPTHRVTSLIDALPGRFAQRAGLFSLRSPLIQITVHTNGVEDLRSAQRTNTLITLTSTAASLHGRRNGSRHQQDSGPLNSLCELHRGTAIAIADDNTKLGSAQQPNRSSGSRAGERPAASEVTQPIVGTAH